MFVVFSKFADWITFSILGLKSQTKLAEAFHFFVEDTSKIFVLLIVMIYFIAILRSSMNMTKVRNVLQGRSSLFGYSVASLFGVMTPFCSCSSIPMFLGFTAAGIQTGVTLAFLISSPLLNEVALVLLGSLLGWEFALTYLVVGLLAAIFGGMFFDRIGAQKYLQPMAQKLQGSQLKQDHAMDLSVKMTFKNRHDFAKKEAKDIFLKIWLWVLLGIAVGAGLHGFVPREWIVTHLGDGAWWSVPLAVLMGIPLYSNASGMVPIVETLLSKGLPAGTALALMLSTVGASFPEFIMLKQVLKPKLLVFLFVYFLIVFTLIGWILNIFF